MNSVAFSNIARFIALLIAQILIFNNIDLFGFINPFPYILFIILYPTDNNKAVFYLTSFFLGLIVDMFENSGGMHAAASLILAFARPSVLKFSFGISYQYHNLNIIKKITKDIFKSLEVFGYISISVVIHHIILFGLEFFRFNFIWEILLRTVLTTITTLLACILILFLIKPSKK
ncbi:rod shape-determining protein MreD [Myroides odoratimimus]|uniref:rod shape-determining protein MreD n=1 Tax=Myroides odoratimimus TaxID=76832 RepID=UPI0025785E10|nr:rod shape-determining protein MreD [Myroides odoratimimus]MDM1397324.1 rod shape-determining protein MreD [Myroides odoratimimus]MDM1528157.1 rod shape-determining protein MreD [Myroides odoratimimus]